MEMLKAAGRAMLKAAEEVNGVESQVEGLLERISEGMLAQDRREGMEQLKALLQQKGAVAVLEAFASMAVPVMCSVLHDDVDDLDLVQGALECLLLATGGPVEDIDEDVEEEQRRIGAAAAAGALTAHALAGNQNHLQLLLSLLESEEGSASDFYARFWTIQLLTRLVHTSPFSITEAVMSRPQGVVKIMDLLREQEVIRNEALLLLIVLSRTDEEVQKIIAFEGAFDMLFEILTEEGYVAGGIIVQDSLVLLNNLLRGNPSNQLMFREAGYIANLHRLLFVESDAAAPTGIAALEQRLQDAGAVSALPPQTCANLLCALEMVLILTAPAQSRGAGADAAAQGRHEMAVVCAEANHALLAKSGTLSEVISLSLREGAEVPLPVRIMALLCAQRLVAGRQAAQDRLSSCNTVIEGRPVPVLQALLHRLLTTGDAAEAAACDQLLAAFCRDNSDGQMALVSTMLPISGARSLSVTASFGELLVAAILEGRENVQASARACVVMCHLLRGNTAAKQKALQVPLTMPAAGRAPAFLIPSVMAQLPDAASGGAAATAARLLRVLIVWAHECPPAVTTILQEPSHLPLLVDIVQGRVGGNNVVLRGLGATLMGCCLLYNESGREDGSIGKLALLDIITARIGLSDYFRTLEALRESELLQEAADENDAPATMSRAAVTRLASSGLATSLSGKPGMAEDNPFDAEFASFMEQFVSVLKQQALALFSQPHSSRSQPPADQAAAPLGNDEAQSLITQLRQEVEELQLRNAALAQDLMLHKAKHGAAGGGGDPEAAAKADFRCSRLQLENDALRREVELLKERAARKEAEARGAHEQAAESTSLLHQLKAELSSLSEAYTALEQDAFTKEAENRQLQQRLSDAAQNPPSTRQPADAAEDGEGLQAELDDLLVCLGQEEQKVAILSDKLAELGVDASALIEHVCIDEDDESVDGNAGTDVHSNVHQWVEDTYAHPAPPSLSPQQALH